MKFSSTPRLRKKAFKKKGRVSYYDKNYNLFKMQREMQIMGKGGLPRIDSTVFTFTTGNELAVLKEE